MNKITEHIFFIWLSIFVIAVIYGIMIIIVAYK